MDSDEEGTGGSHDSKCCLMCGCFKLLCTLGVRYTISSGRIDEYRLTLTGLRKKARAVAIEWLDAVCASYSDLQEKESNDSHVVVRCSTKRKASWVLWALRQYLQERRAAFKSLKHYAHYSEDVFKIDPRSQLFSIVVHIELLACAVAINCAKRSKTLS